MGESTILRDTLAGIDAAIEKYKRDIKRGEDLKILMENEQFKSVILDGYIEEESRRLFRILTDPTGAMPFTEDQLQLKLAAISTFKGYVGTKDHKGTILELAENATLMIAREEDYRREVTAEYAENTHE
jgi:hypothetical protein